MGVIHRICKILMDHFGNDTASRNMLSKDSYARCNHKIDPALTSHCKVQL